MNALNREMLCLMLLIKYFYIYLFGKNIEYTYNDIFLCYNYKFKLQAGEITIKINLF